MSIVTKYLLADEEGKERQRESYMDFLRNSHTAKMAANFKDIPSIFTGVLKETARDAYQEVPGMLSGARDKAQEIGGEWWENISSDKGAYRQEFDAKWFKKLGHSGLPRLENYIVDDAEADLDRDWRENWDTHPDNLSIY